MNKELFTAFWKTNTKLKNESSHFEVRNSSFGIAHVRIYFSSELDNKFDLGSVTPTFSCPESRTGVFAVSSVNVASYAHKQPDPQCNLAAAKTGLISNKHLGT